MPRPALGLGVHTNPNLTTTKILEQTAPQHSMIHHVVFHPTLTDALVDTTPQQGREGREAHYRTPMLIESWRDNPSQNQSRFREDRGTCGATLQNLSSKFY